MKPKRIILIRHGESEGNVDKTVYQRKPDYSINLTKKGQGQAFEAGKRLKEIISDETAFFYVSPFYRTRQTFQEIIKSLEPRQVEYREDPRIREQEWSTCIRAENKAEEELERERTSKFYYRFKTGESCADVYDGRCSTFLDTQMRDFDKPNFPTNCVIIAHGMFNRIYLMRFFHWTVEEFEMVKNPKNCEFYILEKQKFGKYNLVTPLVKRNKLNRKF